MFETKIEQIVKYSNIKISSKLPLKKKINNGPKCKMQTIVHEHDFVWWWK